VRFNVCVQTAVIIAPQGTLADSSLANSDKMIDLSEYTSFEAQPPRRLRHDETDKMDLVFAPPSSFVHLQECELIAPAPTLSPWDALMAKLKHHADEPRLHELAEAHPGTSKDNNGRRNQVCEPNENGDLEKEWTLLLNETYISTNTPQGSTTQTPKAKQPKKQASFLLGDEDSSSEWEHVHSPDL